MHVKTLSEQIAFNLQNSSRSSAKITSISSSDNLIVIHLGHKQK